MNKDEKELFELKFKGVYAQISSNFDLIHVELERIYKEVKLINGEVKEVKKQTTVTRFFETHPKLFFLVIFGFITFFIIRYFLF